jgi:hypothetical protein
MRQGRFLWVVALVVFASGCTRTGAALGMGILAGVVIANAAHHPEPEPLVVERIVVLRDPPVESDPARGSSPPVVVVRPRAPETRFDPEQARASLEHADVAACRARGVSGQVHARVTFGSTGAAKKIVIDAPPGLSSEAVACLGERISTATVPPFDDEGLGGECAASATWFLP